MFFILLLLLTVCCTNAAEQSKEDKVLLEAIQHEKNNTYFTTLLKLQKNGYFLEDSVCHSVYARIKAEEFNRKLLSFEEIKLQVGHVPYLVLKDDDKSTFLYNLQTHKLVQLPPNPIPSDKEYHYKLLGHNFVWSKSNKKCFDPESSYVYTPALSWFDLLDNIVKQYYSSYSVLDIEEDPTGTYIAALLEEQALSTKSYYIGIYNLQTEQLIDKPYPIANFTGYNKYKKLRPRWIQWHTSNTFSTITGNPHSAQLTSIHIDHNALCVENSIKCPKAPLHFHITSDLNSCFVTPFVIYGGKKDLCVARNIRQNSQPKWHFLQLRLSDFPQPYWCDTERIICHIEYYDKDEKDGLLPGLYYIKLNSAETFEIYGCNFSLLEDDRNAIYTSGTTKYISHDGKHCVVQIYCGSHRPPLSYVETACGSVYQTILNDPCKNVYFYLGFEPNSNLLLYAHLSDDYSTLEVCKLKLDQISHIATQCPKLNITYVNNVLDSQSPYFKPNLLTYCAYKLGLSHNNKFDKGLYTYGFTTKDEKSPYILNPEQLELLYKHSLLFKRILDQDLAIELDTSTTNGVYLIKDLNITVKDLRIFFDSLKDNQDHGLCITYYNFNSMSDYLKDILDVIQTHRDLWEYCMLPSKDIYSKDIKKKIDDYIILKNIPSDDIINITDEGKLKLTVNLINKFIEEVKSCNINCFQDIADLFRLKAPTLTHNDILNYEDTRLEKVCGKLSNQKLINYLKNSYSYIKNNALEQNKNIDGTLESHIRLKYTLLVHLTNSILRRYILPFTDSNSIPAMTVDNKDPYISMACVIFEPLLYLLQEKVPFNQ